MGTSEPLAVFLQRFATEPLNLGEVPPGCSREVRDQPFGQ